MKPKNPSGCEGIDGFGIKTSAAECAVVAVISAVLFPLGVALSAAALAVFGGMLLDAWPLGVVDKATGEFAPVIPFQNILGVVVPHVFWAVAAAGGTAVFLWAWEGVEPSKSHFSILALLIAAPLTLWGAWIAFPVVLGWFDVIPVWTAPYVTKISLSSAFFAGVVVTVFRS